MREPRHRGAGAIMQKVHTLKKIPARHIDDPEFRSLMMTKRLGGCAGSERLYVNIDFVKPGGKSVKYHAHSLQEEFFLILKGTGKLRLQGKLFQVKAGDFFAKPGGKRISHQFINDGAEILEILDCGTNDRSDVIEYPDEGIVYLKDRKIALKTAKPVTRWSSDPDE